MRSSTDTRCLDWNSAPLGDLCDVLDRLRKPITKRDREPGPYPYYGATGLLDHVADFIFDEPLVLIGEDGAKWGAGEDSAYRVSGKCWVNNHAHVIRPHREALLDSWVTYYLNGSDLLPFITGLTVPKLNQAKLREIPIPLPPLPEQKRIVSILDAAFAAIDAATAHTEKNLANAQELFNSHLNAVFESPPDGWVTLSVGQLGKVQTGSTPKTSDRQNYGDFIPFIKPADFNRDGSLQYENQGLSEKGLDSARKVDAGSVLMVCIGATIGKVGMADQSVTTNQQINSLTPEEAHSHRLLYYAMSTRDFRRRVLREASQATLPIINKSKWSALTLCLPPTRCEQDRVANRLNDLQEQSQRLASTYTHKLTLLAELKQSILQKAFRGELTAEAVGEKETVA